MLQCVFPSPWKNSLWPLKMHVLPQFLTKVAEINIFCRKLNCLDSQIESFCIFNLFPVKNDTKKCNSKKKSIFKKKIIQKFKKLRCDLLLQSLACGQFIRCTLLFSELLTFEEARTRDQKWLNFYWFTWWIVVNKLYLMKRNASLCMTWSYRG